MATQIDRLQTIIVATGQASYRRAMRTSSMAVKELGVSETLVAAASTNLAAAQQGAAVTATEMATAETGATGATVALGAAISPVTIAIAALTAGVLLSVAAFTALVAVTGLAAGGAAKGLIDVTKAARDAEDALRKAASVAGLTEEEISDLRNSLPLDELAQLGFSGIAAGEGLWFLFSAGQGVEEALDTLGPATLLAAALNTDLASATGVLVSTMKALGIETEDSAAVVDGFAAINAVTMASFDKLQNALTFAAPAARIFGIEFRDMLNILGQFFNVGLRGTMAGRTFRMGLLQLATATDEARSAMKQLGLDSDVAASLLSRPRELIEYLAQAEWDAASAAKVFGAQAITWTQILANGVDVFDELNEALLQTGKAQEQADIAMGGLAGATKVLAADFENMKAKMGEVTQALSVDLVKGAGLAARAFGEAFSEYITILKDSQGETLTTRDVILDTALLIADAMAYAAFGGLALLEVWKKLAIAGQEVYWVSALMAKGLTPAGAVLYRGTTFKEMFANIDSVGKGWKAAEDASDEYGKHVTEVLVRMRNNIYRMRREMGQETGLAAGDPAALAAPPVPPIGSKESYDSVAASIQIAARYLAKLRNEQEWLALSFQEAKALTDDNLTTLALEIEYRRQNLQYAQAITQAIQYAASFEEDEAKAIQQVNAALREQEAARIAILVAEQAYRKAIVQMQEKAWKEADRERMKTARDYDRLIKKSDSVRDAIQAVIGGTLGQGIQEAIGRISGSGWRKGVGMGAVRATGTNEIRVTVDMAGLSEDGKREITNHFYDVLSEGAAQLPAVSY